MLDLENLPRAVRAMKCQALASELAKLRAELAAMRRGGENADLARVNISLRGVDELEKALTEVMGTPEQRALEEAESQVEHGLKEALLEEAVRQTKASAAGVKLQLDKLWALQRVAALGCREVFSAPSEYTGEAEEKLARIRSHVMGMNGTDMPAKLRVVLTAILGAE